MLNELVLGTCAVTTLSISCGSVFNEDVADVFSAHESPVWPSEPSAFNSVQIDVQGPVIEVDAQAESAKWFPDASERKVFRKALLRSSKVVHTGRLVV